MKYWLVFVASLSLTASAQTIEFKLRNDYLILTRCSIGDRQDLVAVIDTGVSETAIDAKLAKRLRLPTNPDAAIFGTRSARVSAVSIPELAVGGVRAGNLAGVVIDGSTIERELGIHADVIIGMDVLERNRFTIDYKAKTMTFGTAPQFAHTAPLIHANHLALVSALVGKARLVLQLDTGLNGILIYGGRTPVSEHTLNSNSVTPTGATSLQTASVSLRIGDWEKRQATVAVTDDKPQGGAPFDGLLGITSIGAHRVSFDWQKGAMSWE